MDLSPGSEIRKFLNKKFQHKYNKPFHKWYYTNMSEEQRQFYKTAYLHTLEFEEQLKFFLHWFLDYYVK